MNSKDFIISKIDMLVQRFPSIKCKYEFDENDDTHTVEISPLPFFESDEEFKEIEKAIYIEFFNLYPFEGLFFINEESLYPLSNPIYTKSGVTFNLQPEFNIPTIFTSVQVPMPIISTLESLNKINSIINVQISNREDSSITAWFGTELLEQNIIIDIITKADNTSYALAA